VTDAIAEGTQVPRGYLSKVLQALARAQLVVSQRGLGGGFALAQPATQITALQVLAAVEPMTPLATCPLELPHHQEALCPLHQRLADAQQTVTQALAKSSLAELVAKPNEKQAFCSQHRSPPPRGRRPRRSQ